MSRTVRAALTFALISAAPAYGQLMGSRELTTVGVVKGAPASKPAPDIYYLAGESGAKETYSLTIKGPASLTLFTPDGHEMVSATGSGKVTLTAYLPLTDVFTLAVSRRTPAQPYTLSRAATVPTLAEAQAFFNVGYRLTDGTNGGFAKCWITPGVKYRASNEVRTFEHTLGADHKTLTTIGRERDKTWSYDITYSLAGSVLTYHYRYPSGKTVDHTQEFKMGSLADGKTRKFSGYLCAN